MREKDFPTKGGKICGVVVTYNRKALLEQCLKALIKQTKPLDEVIVIDNASTDGTDDMVISRFPEVTYVKLPENRGGAGGFHEGIKLAFDKGYDWIWIMDDDAIPLVDALEKLTNTPTSTQGNVYALASAVLNRDNSICLGHRRTFDAKRAVEKPIDASMYKLDCFQIDTASFVGFMLSREAISEVGLPLSKLFIYYDDTEYSLRIRQRGLIVTIPSSRVVHDSVTSIPDKFAQLRRPIGWRQYYAHRNRIYTYRKYSRSLVKFRIRLFAEMLLALGALLLFRPSKLQGIKILLCSLQDGFQGKLGKNTALFPG